MNQKFLSKQIARMKTEFIYANYMACDKSFWFESEQIPQFNRFYLVSEGEGYVEIDGKPYIFGENQLLLVPRGHTFSYRMTDKNKLVKYWCHFNAVIGDRHLTDLIETQYLIQADFAELSEKFKKLITLSERSGDVASALRVNSVLLEIIAYYIENSKIFESGVLKQEENLNAALLFIDNNLGRHITVQDVAETVHLHPNYFIKRFKNLYGITPLQYINTARTDKAKQLLENSEMSVGDVARNLGFEDDSYFSKSFKNAVGYTPSNYRRMLKKLYENPAEKQ